MNPIGPVLNQETFPIVGPGAGIPAPDQLTWGFVLGDGFGVVPEDLRAHIGRLGEVTDALDEALKEATGAASPPDAFGVLFPSIPEDLRPQVDGAVEAMRGAVDSVRTTSELVGDALAEYDAIDGDNAESLRAFEAS